MNSKEYMDRLKSIRQKYGCSPAPETGRNTQAPLISHDSYQYLDTKKPLDSGSSILTRLNAQETYGKTNYGNASRKLEREKEIERIRENYAESRRKVIEDFTSKNSYKESDLPSRHTANYKSYREADFDYVKEDHNRPTSSYLRNDVESVSPIKRVTDFTRRQSKYQLSPEIPRERRLGELPSNRMKEIDLLSVEKKYIRPSSVSSRYDSSKLRSPSRVGGSNNIENARPSTLTTKDYSVGNIDRIQQRIQSILDRK